MNSEEILVKNVIDYFKEKNGNVTKPELKIIASNNGWNIDTAIGILKDFKLIDNISPQAYRLTAKGLSFESIEKLNYEKNLNIDLAESNIEANKLNKKNSGFNRTATIVNVIIGLLNVGLLIFQIIKH